MSDRDRVSKTITRRYCSHADCDVELKTTYIFPSDILPETPPRISQRSCSHYFACGLHDKSACTYAIDAINKPNVKAEHSG